jgi:hypothetical protein
LPVGAISTTLRAAEPISMPTLFSGVAMTVSRVSMQIGVVELARWRCLIEERLVEMILNGV